MMDAKPDRAIDPPALPFRAMLRSGLIAGLACLPVLVILFWILRNGGGAASAALGAVIAIVFFAGGLSVLMRFPGDNALLLLAAALAVYLGQVIFLGAVILVLSGRDWIDGWSFGLSVLVVAIVWQIAQVTAYLRAPKPVYSQLDSVDRDDQTPAA